jgi:hypothetical protein
MPVPRMPRAAIALLLMLVLSACTATGDVSEPRQPGQPVSPGPAPTEAGQPSQSGAPQPGPSQPPAPASPPPSAEGPTAPDPAPASAEVSLYTLADLRAGKLEPSTTWQIPGPVAGFAMGPDGRTALLYPNAWEPGVGPLLLDLSTGTKTKLPAPNGRDDWYAAGGWLPDGRIYLVGAGGVWVGAPGGEMKSLGEAFAWMAVPSPSGRYLALWGPTESGGIHVVDFQEDTLRRIPGPFRRGAQDGGVTLGWSPDERFLAGTDFDSDIDGSGMKVRIIDPFTSESVRTIPEVGFMAWLPGGGVLAFRKADGGEVAIRNVVVDADGTEAPFPEEYTGFMHPSPDGRYLVYMAYKRNYGIIDLQTGERFGADFADVPRWTPTSDLVVLHRKWGL